MVISVSCVDARVYNSKSVRDESIPFFLQLCFQAILKNCTYYAEESADYALNKISLSTILQTHSTCMHINN